ncbi:uncharacterized protein VTP21DRAFT_10996 [Calcarisporiella thermophila]|uniref:uncharacterized protein n=1 Tax=Calcarisporiella thermophila TaxID=911321 RepID=UPI00374315CB
MVAAVPPTPESSGGTQKFDPSSSSRLGHSSPSSNSSNSSYNPERKPRPSGRSRGGGSATGNYHGGKYNRRQHRHEHQSHNHPSPHLAHPHIPPYGFDPAAAAAAAAMYAAWNFPHGQPHLPPGLHSAHQGGEGGNPPGDLLPPHYFFYPPTGLYYPAPGQYPVAIPPFFPNSSPAEKPYLSQEQHPAIPDADTNASGSQDGEDTLPEKSPEKAANGAASASSGGEELRQALRKQLEYYFSKENLSKDAYLVSHMDSNLFVPITVIAEFKMVKHLTTDLQLIVSVLKESPNIVVDDSETRAKPNIPANKRNTIILRDVPSDVTEEEIRSIFQVENSRPIVSIKPEIGNLWYITFETEEDTLEMWSATRNKTLRGKQIASRIKSENMLKSFYHPDALGQLKGGPSGDPHISPSIQPDHRHATGQPIAPVHVMNSYQAMGPAIDPIYGAYYNQALYPPPMYPSSINGRWLSPPYGYIPDGYNQYYDGNAPVPPPSTTQPSPNPSKEEDNENGSPVLNGNANGNGSDVAGHNKNSPLGQGWREKEPRPRKEHANENRPGSNYRSRRPFDHRMSYRRHAATAEEEVEGLPSNMASNELDPVAGDPTLISQDNQGAKGYPKHAARLSSDPHPPHSNSLSWGASELQYAEIVGGAFETGPHTYEGDPSFPRDDSEWRKSSEPKRGAGSSRPQPKDGNRSSRRAEKGNRTWIRPNEEPLRPAPNLREEEHFPPLPTAKSPTPDKQVPTPAAHGSLADIVKRALPQPKSQTAGHEVDRDTSFPLLDAGSAAQGQSPVPRESLDAKSNSKESRLNDHKNVDQAPHAASADATRPLPLANGRENSPTSYGRGHGFEAHPELLSAGSAENATGSSVGTKSSSVGISYAQILKQTKETHLDGKADRKEIGEQAFGREVEKKIEIKSGLKSE